MTKLNLSIGERELIVSLDNFAEAANGEATLRYGDTVVFATATMSKKDTEKDFFPLSVSYEEKFYAAGKISGPRYTRREGRPSDRATLISRMIDRAIRPKFSEELKKEVQIIVTCLSWDGENDPGVLGIIAASLALHVSNIPWNGPLGAIRIGKEEDYILNPNYLQRDEGKMDLCMTGFPDREKGVIINMIEGSFNELPEKDFLNALPLIEDNIKKICDFQEEIREKEGKQKIEISPSLPNEEIEKEIREKVLPEAEKIFSQREDREEKLRELKEEVSQFIEKNYEEEHAVCAKNCLEKLIKQVIRKNILEKEERVDGRSLEEVREIKISVGLLPRTHGSGFFQRGMTKSLSIITLGAPGEQQLLEDMESSTKKRFMHHYNFPPYSVGEVRPVRGPGRREIGHGMLAEKALLPLLPNIDIFPYTIRSVSEILTSNGSTSMASVCSTSIALMDAGVPVKSPVAGISVGLVTGDGKAYKLLTDIQGSEDHCGDMDFKVAGTRDGITAIQMDVKIEGITRKQIEESLDRAKKARLYILDEINKVIAKPRENLSPYAPRIVTLKIDPAKIGDVIGPRGKTINEIIEGTEVSIDIDDSGLISITSENEESIQKAVSWIKDLTREIKEGEIFHGRVVKLFNFGAVLEILPGQEGLCHISEIASYRVKSVEDELKIGQVVPVKVIRVEEGGKISLSLKQAKENAKSQ